MYDARFMPSQAGSSHAWSPPSTALLEARRSTQYRRITVSQVAQALDISEGDTLRMMLRASGLSILHLSKVSIGSEVLLVFEVPGLRHEELSASETMRLYRDLVNKQ